MVRLKGDTQVQVLLALLYYDYILFYTMNDTDTKIECLKKKIYVWRKYQNIMAKIDFTCINIIYEYNYNMNIVDIAEK